MSPNRFRALIVAYLFVFAASLWFDLRDDGYSAELAAAFEREPEAPLFRNLPAAITSMSAILLASLVGLIGLIAFRSWGRWLSLVSTAAGIAILPFLGPSLSSPIVSMLGQIASLLWGSILTLAYFSELKHVFESSRKPAS